MVTNFFTISEIAKYLNNNVKDYFIKEIYSQEKNKFLIELSNDHSENAVLEFSIEKDNIYLLLKHNFSKAKKNYADLFDEVSGLKILEISIYNNDRVIKFSLENDFVMFFTFFVNKSNCYIIKNSVVINSFKDKSDYLDRNIDEVIPEIVKTDTAGKVEENISVKNFVKSNYRKYGTGYVKEVLFRTSILETDVIDEKNKEILEKTFYEINESLKSPVYLLYKTDTRFIVSLINLLHLAENEKSEFENVNQLIAEYQKLKFRSEKISTFKSSKENELNSKLKGIEKKIEGINTQLMHCIDSDSLRKEGEIIIQNSYAITKGEKIFSYVDEINNIVKIKLKENLSPVENAQYYFDKYKKQKASVELLKTKITHFEKEKEKIMKEIEAVKEVDDIKKIVKEEKKSAENKNDETSRFRKFKLTEKYEVWVGKDSASNDLLTTKYSAQNDLWFHVRGASGSHTVLKLSNKKEDVGKEIISAAASIAAYYSKARNSSSVPVAYCEKKHVKKKKGFKQGSVVMEREKVIFVKPLLPENN